MTGKEMDMMENDAEILDVFLAAPSDELVVFERCV
jgi:hypothetical protein